MQKAEANAEALGKLMKGGEGGPAIDKAEMLKLVAEALARSTAPKNLSGSISYKRLNLQQSSSDPFTGSSPLLSYPIPPRRLILLCGSQMCNRSGQDLLFFRNFFLFESQNQEMGHRAMTRLLCLTSCAFPPVLTFLAE